MTMEGVLSMLDFKQRTVMITGAAGNLGRAVASAFRMQGANLVLLDINAGALDEAYPGDDEHFFKCEVWLYSVYYKSRDNFLKKRHKKSQRGKPLWLQLSSLY